jgi:uncharacterized protein (DUF433 family)
MTDVMTQHIVTTPGVLGGKPHIAGHRIRVMDIVVWHEKRGLSADEIVSLVYPTLSLADVYAALAYYFDHRDDIEADFAHEAARVAEVRPHYSSKLGKKLSG